MIIEFEAAEGGEDAMLFAEELKQAFKNWLSKNFSVKVHPASLEVNAPREQIVPFTGIHRVQRISNDKKGRRHTSSVNVSVYDNFRKTTLEIEDEDVRIDFFRGTGPGGQHRNKTSTAVRVHHYPTGITVTRTSGRSQSSNLQSAKNELKQKLQDLNQSKTHELLLLEKNQQIAGGESSKSFTHNQQRNETINHATGQRWRMSDFMKGKM